MINQNTSIKEYFNDFLYSKYSDSYYEQLLLLPIEQLLPKFQDFDLRQATAILNKKPEIAIAENEGFHCLHHAILSNNPEVLSLVINTALQQQSDFVLPLLPGYLLKDVANTLSCFSLAAYKDCQHSLAVLFSRINEPEKQIDETLVKYTLKNKSQKCARLLSKVPGINIQELYFNYIYNRNKNYDSSYHIYEFITFNMDADLNNLSKYGIKAFYNSPGQPDFFNLILQSMVEDNYYSYMNDDKKNFMLHCVNFFLKTHKAKPVIDLDNENNNSKTSREYLDIFMNYKSNNSSLVSAINKNIIEYDKYYLEKNLPKSTQHIIKKVKI